MSTRDFWHPGAFIKHLAEKRGIPQHRGMVVEGDYEIYSLDLTRLHLNVSSFTPFVVNKRLSAMKTVTADQIIELLPTLHNLYKKDTASFSVLVVGGTLEQDSTGLLQNLRNAGVAMIDQRLMSNISAAEDYKTSDTRLAEALVIHVGRDLLSPYIPGRIATGGRFFGRIDLLNRTVIGKFGGNFTFIGNRRIGKTSLLREIKRRLVQNDEHLRTVDVYGNNCNTTYDAVKMILDSVRPDLASRMANDSSIVDSLPNHIASMTNNVVIFVDELDWILGFDSRQNYQLLNLLRATSENECCRIFFAGFRQVMKAKKNLDTPLHNFTSFLQVTGLSREETNQMITGPLTNLGIKLDPVLLAKIQQESSGHPELIQLFCRTIVDYFREHNRAPNTNDLLYQVSIDDNFRTIVYSTFIKNTNAYEKLLCFSLFRRLVSEGTNVDGFEFTIKECDEALKAVGRSLTHDNLETLTQNLRVAGVFADVKGALNRYRFAVPRLAEYCSSHDLDWSISKAKEELASESEAITLHLEPNGGADA